MSSRAQPRKKPPGAPDKAATTKTTAERLLATERRLCEDRRALEAHAMKLAESLDKSSDAATARLAERMETLKKRLRDLLGPARAMDMALQRLEDARAGLPIADGAQTLLDAYAEAYPFSTSYDPDTQLAPDASPEAHERAALDLFDDLHRQCEAIDTAVKKAEAEAQAAYNKIVKPVREQQIPACLAAAKRCAQTTRNVTATRNGRPLPFRGLGTAVEVHEAAVKALAVKADLVERVTAMIDAIEIDDGIVAGAPASADDFIIDEDESPTVEACQPA